MKLSEIDPNSRFKILVYGDSGTGKTCFACSFPTPILFLDFDGKITSAARFYRNDKERLSQIEVIDLSPKLKEDPTNLMLEQFRKLEDGPGEYKTIVIDSITTFSALYLRATVKTNPLIKRLKAKQGDQPCMQDYGILKREFGKTIPGLLSLDCNVVMCGHMEIIKDELTGELVRIPQMDGSFAQQLNIYFEEVYRSYINERGEFKLQTQGCNKFKCRSQIPKLPKIIDPNYENLLRRIK